MLRHQNHIDEQTYYLLASCQNAPLDTYKSPAVDMKEVVKIDRDEDRGGWSVRKLLTQDEGGFRLLAHIGGIGNRDSAEIVALGLVTSDAERIDPDTWSLDISRAGGLQSAQLNALQLANSQLSDLLSTAMSFRNDLRSDSSPPSRVANSFGELGDDLGR